MSRTQPVMNRVAAAIAAAGLVAVALAATLEGGVRLALAALAGRFAPAWRLSARDIATAIIGGLLMGYGARLAYGCNIGGFLGGVVSGSLHGWGWLVFGFLGNALGAWLRGPGAKHAATTVSERGGISA